MTTPSTRRAPVRARAASMCAASGPVSTSNACAPSRTSIESPWPTSMTVMDALEPLGIPHATGRSASKAATQHARATTTRGCGHQIHSATAAPTASRQATHPASDIGTAAPGIPASAEAKSLSIDANAPPQHNTTCPAAGQSAATARPARPTENSAVTNGMATRLESGAISETIPKAVAVSGRVARTAHTVTANAGASGPSRLPNAARSHSPASAPNTTIPARPRVESWNPRSKRAGGDAQRNTPATTASPASPLARRPR